MTRTFIVTITTKRGWPMPTAERIKTAVGDTGISWEAINHVEVEKVPRDKKVQTVPKKGSKAGSSTKGGAR